MTQEILKEVHVYTFSLFIMPHLHTLLRHSSTPQMNGEGLFGSRKGGVPQLHLPPPPLPGAKGI